MIDVMNGATGAINGIDPTPAPPAKPEPTPEDKE
jgi:hypothetical protein